MPLGVCGLLVSYLLWFLAYMRNAGLPLGSISTHLPLRDGQTAMHSWAVATIHSSSEELADVMRDLQPWGNLPLNLQPPV